MRKRFFLYIWTAYFLVVIAVGCTFYCIFNGYIGYMPEIEELENPVNKFASQVISSDGKLIGTWSYSRANRIFVGYDDISPSVIQALVATEDERFYEHSGIDFKALFRAIVKRGILMQKSAGGGSTITQQLAKQLYSEKAENVKERLLQKPIEWVIALRLEKYYTKEEIITMYLNHFDFLHNAVGIKTAAKTYFGKDPKELTVDESAILVGMCKNPSYFNPVRNPERCVQRRNVVISQMEKVGYLSTEEADQLKLQPLNLNFHRNDHKEGAAAYLRDYLRQVLMAKKPKRSDYASWQNQKFYEDSLAWETDPSYGWCNKNVKRDGTNYNIYTDGLKVYTTIDSRMQKYAEEAVNKHVVDELQPIFEKELKYSKNAPYASSLSADEAAKNFKRAKHQCARYIQMKANGYSESEIEDAFNTPIEMTVYTPHGEIDTLMTPSDSIKYYKRFLRAGFMVMENETGYVRAYVGGTNFSHFQYDMCTQGRRQVGSTIKPYLYSLAMENGWSPCDEAPNIQQTYQVGNKTWTPRNGSKARYGEMVTLKWGLAMSNNWISAWLMNQMSPPALVRLLHEYGILNRDIVPSMSLCLGPCDISVGEMASAYTAFVNHGIRASLMFVTKIEDGEGNVIAQFQPRMNEVISEESANKMIYMLKSVVDGGTASRLRFKYNLKGDIGGKTGTTNNNSDAWFMGLTPNLVNACWVGGDDRDIHFDSMAMGQGASMALPIFALYMQKVYADNRLGYTEDAVFDIPAGFNPCPLSDGTTEDDEVNGIEEIFE